MWSQSYSRDKNKMGFPLALKSLFLFCFTAFSVFFHLAKLACTSSVNCSSYATVGYSTGRAMSMDMDSQSPNVLAADSDSGSV